MFPEVPSSCPLTTNQASGKCVGWFDGYRQAITDASSAGYLNNNLLSPLTISEAQMLMPSIILVLATAFGARLIIQLVKG